LKNKDTIFGIKNTCNTISNITICNRNNIINISNTTCIPNLLKSLHSSCAIVNNQHVPVLEEITPGFLFLNQFVGTIVVNNNSHALNGTFVVEFHNTTVMANDETFINREQSHLRSLPAILQPATIEKEFKELLSLELMKAIQINNTKTISSLQSEKIVHHSVTYGLIAIIFIMTAAMVTKNILNLILQPGTLEGNHHVEIELKPTNSNDPDDPDGAGHSKETTRKTKFYEV
jgi:Gypsy protein